MGREPLLQGVELDEALLEAARSGAAFVGRALAEPFRRRLQEEIEAGPFEPVPERVGPVRQETEQFVVDPRAFPAVAALERAVGADVRAAGRGIRGLATWRPNEAAVQRYAAGSRGITPHLDGKRFRRLVAVFTTEGSARFAVCRDRDGEVLREWLTEPGSLVLLRGPGLAGARDGRPFHRLDGPTSGMRYSVAFRMEAGRQVAR